MASVLLTPSSWFLPTFARSLTSQAGSLSRAATDRTIYVVSDLNHLVAEHFAKVTVRCVKSRRQNIARVLNFSEGAVAQAPC